MGWARRGRRLRVPTTSQHRERLNLFGWVAPLLGRRGMIRWPRGDRGGFITCLKDLYHRLRGYTIWLYVDRARWHKGEEVDLFVRTHMRLRLRYLPSYQPGLNPQERIWRQVRYETTTNCWFETLDLVWDTVQRTTRTWTPNKIRRLCQIT
jgi:DDE superfamily endonuclease